MEVSRDDPRPERIDPPQWPPSPVPKEFTETQAVRIGSKWLRDKFSKQSLAVIGSLVLTGGSYLWHLSSRLDDVEGRMRVIDGRIPTGDINQHVNEEISTVRENLAGLSAQQRSQEKHLEANDDKIDGIYEVFDPDAVKKMRAFSKRNRKQ